MADLHNTTSEVLVLSSSTSDNTALTTSAIDLAGWRGCEIYVMSQTLADADATFAVEIRDSDDDVTYTAVDDKYLLGLESELAFAAASDDNKVKSIGYNGINRYAKAVITPSNNASAAGFSVLAVRSNPMKS